jgi:hypothetical protein
MSRTDGADSPILKRLGYIFSKDKAQWGKWTEHKWKNINPVEIPTILGLTDLQVEDEVPLRYQLSSILHIQETVTQGVLTYIRIFIQRTRPAAST